jgi:hypothetical protein
MAVKELKNLARILMGKVAGAALEAMAGPHLGPGVALASDALAEMIGDGVSHLLGLTAATWPRG